MVWDSAVITLLLFIQTMGEPVQGNIVAQLCLLQPIASLLWVRFFLGWTKRLVYGDISLDCIWLLFILVVHDLPIAWSIIYRCTQPGKAARNCILPLGAIHKWRPVKLKDFWFFKFWVFAYSFTPVSFSWKISPIFDQNYFHLHLISNFCTPHFQSNLSLDPHF